MSSLNSAAAEWLASGPNGIQNEAFIAEILASFAGLPRLAVLTGPETLLRAVGQNESGKLANPYAGYWVRDSILAPIYRRLGQFDGWLQQQDLSAMAEWRYRALTAVCINWNNFSEFAELRLPAGETVPCLIGPVAPQPLHQSMDRALATTPVMRGGAEQIFFRGGDASPFWIRIRSKSDLF